MLNTYFKSGLYFLVTGLGCLSCYFLREQFGFSAVLASVLVCFFGSVNSVFNLSEQNKNTFMQALYAGSFAGMISLNLIEEPLDIYILCILVGLSFVICNPYFKGFGGKLGSVAFIASLSFYMLRLLW